MLLVMHAQWPVGTHDNAFMAENSLNWCRSSWNTVCAGDKAVEILELIGDWDGRRDGKGD